MPKKGKVRRGTPARVRKSKKLARTPAKPTRAPGARGSSISRRISETEKAIKTLGEKNVRRGSHVLGETRKVTPTKRGFGTVRKALKSVAKVSKAGRTFTYDIEGEYRGADGKLHKFKREQIGVPRMRDIRRRRGESKEEALTRTVEDRIRLDTFKILQAQLGGYQVARAGTVVGGRTISRKQAAAQLRKIKRSRQVKIKVRFRREV